MVSVSVAPHSSVIAAVADEGIRRRYTGSGSPAWQNTTEPSSAQLQSASCISGPVVVDPFRGGISGTTCVRVLNAMDLAVTRNQPSVWALPGSHRVGGFHDSSSVAGFELSSHDRASAENGPHHPRQAEPRAMVAPPQLIYLRCNSVVTILITPEVFECHRIADRVIRPQTWQITRANPTTSAGKSLQSS